QAICFYARLSVIIRGNPRPNISLYTQSTIQARVASSATRPWRAPRIKAAYTSAEIASPANQAYVYTVLNNVGTPPNASGNAAFRNPGRFGNTPHARAMTAAGFQPL